MLLESIWLKHKVSPLPPVNNRISESKAENRNHNTELKAFSYILSYFKKVKIFFYFFFFIDVIEHFRSE